MPSATENSSATANTAGIDTADRLSFTLFLAVALHALLILGISFSAESKQKIAPTLQVTLATHRAQKKPEEADYLAQFNQEASGTEKSKKELTTERESQFADSRINDIAPTPQVKATTAQHTEHMEQITSKKNTLKISAQADRPPSQEQQEKRGQETERPPINTELASLQAKLDRQKQAYAKRPRKRFLTSVSTLSSQDAEYYARFRQKVEQVGNDNYPPEAIIKKIIGDLRMVTVINANGTIAAVEIMHSSGYRLLDNAAKQIVHLAAPFAPFPKEIRKNTDQLEIIRTWHFDITGLTTSN